MNPFATHFESLEEFADRVSELLQCPITIEDANHRLIAYSGHEHYTDPARTATIIHRRVPERVINSLWREGVIPRLLQSEEPVRVAEISEVGLGNRIAISIWRNKEVLGFIWAIEMNEPWTEQQFDLLKQAAKAAKNLLLQLQIRKHKKEERIQEFFWKLLTGHFPSPHEVIEQCHQLNVHVYPFFSVGIFQFQQHIQTQVERQIDYLLKTTQQLAVPLYTIDHQRLIVLVAPSSDVYGEAHIERFFRSFMTQMRERFRVDIMMGAFGNVYECYTKIAKSYEEAQTVLKMKRAFPHQLANIQGYQHLGMYQFFDLLFEKKRHGDFHNVALEKLKQYDAQHHTNLVETIETYLDFDSNVNETAKALNIHPNTLAYRLKRISEIGNIDLSNMGEKVKLYIDMKLDKYRTT
ncbi:helix-turn-helix domain-containing protein [Anoxybacillus eryuanensis]|uniref:helix-turn-helix domain-containing protein n=1 Tax=Anoxybacillus eryuanensis TaxID=651866 RepID=UPI003EF82589